MPQSKTYRRGPGIGAWPVISTASTTTIDRSFIMAASIGQAGLKTRLYPNHRTIRHDYQRNAVCAVCDASLSYKSLAVSRARYGMLIR